MSTVNIFRTNVDNRTNAKAIENAIRKALPGSDPSFDLEDSDRVLRIEHSDHGLDKSTIERILKKFNYTMEVLT